MGIVVRQSFKGTIVTYLGIVIGTFNLLFLFPKFLSAEEIGLSRVLVDLAMLMAGLSQIGLPNIIDRFFPFFKSEEKSHNGFFLFVLLFPILGLFVVCGAFLLTESYWAGLYAAKSPLFAKYVLYVVPLTVFYLYQQVLESYCRVHLRIVIPSFVREVWLRLFLLTVVTLYFYQWIDISGLVIGLVLSYLSAVLILLFYIYQLRRLYWNDKSFWQQKVLLKDMVIFGLFIFMSGATGLIASKVDVLILSAYSGLAFTGVYTIAFFMGTIIEIPRRALSQILTPIISQAWKENDIAKIADIYRKSTINQFIVGCLLFVLLLLNLDDIYTLIPNSHIYESGKMVVVIIAVCRLWDMLTGVNSEIILTSPYYKFNLVLSVFSSIITLGVNFLLIPEYGMLGAAYSVLVGFFLFNTVKMVYIYVKVGIQPLSFPVVPVALISLAILGISYIPGLSGDLLSAWVMIPLRSLLIASAFILPVYLLKLSPEINTFIDQLLLRFKR